MQTVSFRSRTTVPPRPDARALHPRHFAATEAARGSVVDARLRARVTCVKTPGGPSWDVEVKIAFGHPNYVNLAESMYGSDSQEWWEELGDLLGGRSGWHCELTNSGLMWSFGPAGSSMFNITAPEEGLPTDGYDLFDYDDDRTIHFDSTHEMREGLEDNESRHTDHLRGIHWELGRAPVWRVKVDVDEEVWLGTVEGIPMEVVTAANLPSLLRAARGLVVHAFGAPTGSVSEVKLDAVLSPTAADALAK